MTCLRSALAGLTLCLLLLPSPAHPSEGSVLLSYQGMEDLRRKLADSLWELDARVKPTRSEYAPDSGLVVTGQAVAFQHPVHGLVLLHSLDLTRGADVVALRGPGKARCTIKKRFEDRQLNLGFIQCQEALDPTRVPALAGTDGNEPELYFSVDNPRAQFASIFHHQGRAWCEPPLAEFLCIPLGALFSSPLFDSEGRLAGITLRRLGIASKLSITVSAAQLRSLRLPPRRPPTLELRPHEHLIRPFVL